MSNANSPFQRRYPPELREQAVRMVHETIAESGERVGASAAFVKDHFGFTEVMPADGFVSLTRANAGFNLIYLDTNLATLKPERLRGRRAEGVLVVFVVEDVDSEYERLRTAGVPIVTPIETEAWGERYFQVSDPNGVIIQLVQWVDA